MTLFEILNNPNNYDAYMDLVDYFLNADADTQKRITALWPLGRQWDCPNCKKIRNLRELKASICYYLLDEKGTVQRDSLITMAAEYNSAILLGFDPDELLTELAEKASPVVANFLFNCMDRFEFNKGLTGFGFKIVFNEKGEFELGEPLTLIAGKHPESEESDRLIKKCEYFKWVDSEEIKNDYIKTFLKKQGYPKSIVMGGINRLLNRWEEVSKLIDAQPNQTFFCPTFNYKASIRDLIDSLIYIMNTVDKKHYLPIISDLDSEIKSKCYFVPSGTSDRKWLKEVGLNPEIYWWHFHVPKYAVDKKIYEIM